ncbi:DNA-binding protein [Trichinella spiralis]|uniref:DNA-binding protein n=1 Tax=Trichinella spiralis TaxID=6334 RepID=A0ABR3KIA5_TRISP
MAALCVCRAAATFGPTSVLFLCSNLCMLSPFPMTNVYTISKREFENFVACFSIELKTCWPLERHKCRFFNPPPPPPPFISAAAVDFTTKQTARRRPTNTGSELSKRFTPQLTVGRHLLQPHQPVTTGPFVF